MKVDDPQLSWVCLVIHCVLCVNLLFRKFVGCGGPKLTGGASGQGVLRETFGPEPLVEGNEKKGNMSITVLPPRKFWFLILFSFCLLTVTLYSHFKQSTHAQKSVFHSFPIHYISFFFFVNKRQTRTHKELSGMLIIFFIVFCLVVRFGVNLFVTIFFCSIFGFANLCCHIAVSKAVMQ